MNKFKLSDSGRYIVWWRRLKDVTTGESSWECERDHKQGLTLNKASELRTQWRKQHRLDTFGLRICPIEENPNDG